KQRHHTAGVERKSESTANRPAGEVTTRSGERNANGKDRPPQGQPRRGDVFDSRRVFPLPASVSIERPSREDGRAPLTEDAFPSGQRRQDLRRPRSAPGSDLSDQPSGSRRPRRAQRRRQNNDISAGNRTRGAGPRRDSTAPRAPVWSPRTTADLRKVQHRARGSFIGICRLAFDRRGNVSSRASDGRDNRRGTRRSDAFVQRSTTRLRAQGRVHVPVAY